MGRARPRGRPRTGVGMTTSEAITQQIRVAVRSRYVPERSDPAEERWFFAYTIRITNLSDETVQLVLSTPTNASLAATSATGTIVNDDGTSGTALVSIAAAPATIVEAGGVATVTVTMSPSCWFDNALTTRRNDQAPARRS